MSAHDDLELSGQHAWETEQLSIRIWRRHQCRLSCCQVTRSDERELLSANASLGADHHGMQSTIKQWLPSIRLQGQYTARPTCCRVMLLSMKASCCQRVLEFAASWKTVDVRATRHSSIISRFKSTLFIRSTLPKHSCAALSSGAYMLLITGDYRNIYVHCVFHVVCQLCQLCLGTN